MSPLGILCNVDVEPHQVTCFMVRSAGQELASVSVGPLAGLARNEGEIIWSPRRLIDDHLRTGIPPT